MDGAARRLANILRSPTGGGLMVALLVCVLWVTTRDTRPPQPTADVYTHLSVARHVVRGEGFRTDVTYPLSFAWPFARELPQPLVHRRPGLATILTVPVAATGGDPDRGVAGTRLVMILMTAALAGLGTAGLLARGSFAGVVPWLLLLGWNPLWGFAVDWGFEEVPAALLLLALWLRRAPGGPRPVDGLLAGVLGLFRLELLILPLLWWLSGGQGRPERRRILATAAVAIAVLLPWAIRDLALTGRPVFLVQGQAELVKDTREWPGYAVYRGLDPQPPLTALRDSGVSILRKGWRGLRFYRENAGDLVPWPVALAAVLAAGGAVLLAAGRRRIGPGLVPWSLAGWSFVLLAGLYALFDHSLRHLLVLTPVLLWETARLLEDLGRRTGSAIPAALLPAALAANLLWICPSPLTGWHFAAGEAVRLAPEIPRRVAALLADPARVPFVEDAATPWYADRAAAWTPVDSTTAARISAWLEQP